MDPNFRITALPTFIDEFQDEFQETELASIAAG